MPALWHAMLAWLCFEYLVRKRSAPVLVKWSRRGGWYVVLIFVATVIISVICFHAPPDSRLNRAQVRWGWG
jgi:hypothetical protein